MPKKRKRKVLNWPPILWTLVVLNVALGFMFSRATAATVVRVYGALDQDRAQITRDLQFLKDRPCLRVDKATMEEKLMFLPHVKSATLDRNIFGRAEVRFKQRVPVALVGNSLIDTTGVVYSGPVPATQLPSVMYPPGMQISGGITSTMPIGKVVELATQIASRPVLRSATIEVRSGGSVCLHVKQGPKIELGRIEDLEQKLKAFDEQLRLNPFLLEESSSLSFVNPNQPAQKKKLK